MSSNLSPNRLSNGPVTDHSLADHPLNGHEADGRRSDDRRSDSRPLMDGRPRGDMSAGRHSTDQALPDAFRELSEPLTWRDEAACRERPEIDFFLSEPFGVAP